MDLSFKNDIGIDENYIIGCIVYNYKKATTKYMKFSFKFIYEWNNSVYIMTIGTINEFRGRGLATLFLEHLKEETSENESIRYIYLHVVKYNHSGRKFYTKNEF